MGKIRERVGTPTHQTVNQVNGFPRYSEDEMRRRHDGLRRLMEEEGVEAAVIAGATGPFETSVQYFSNWPPLVESYLVFPAQQEPVLLVRLWNHLPDAQRASVVSDVRYGGDTPLEQAQNVASVLKALGLRGKAVGFIGPFRYADMQAISSELPNLAWRDLNPGYQAFRLVKSDEEMVYTRVAAAMGDRAVEAMEAEIKPGLREYEIAKIIEDVYLDQRGVNLIHFTLTTSMNDPQVCVPHQYHPDRLVQEGDVVVTEISTTFWGYAGQILRSFTVAAEPTPLYRELHDVAVETYQGIADVLQTGTRIGEVLDVAQQVHEAGYSIWDDLVHGFGGAYLPPIVRTRNTRGATHSDDFEYPAGTVLVVQPNVITLDEKAGVQVGNALRVLDDGVEVLQDYPVQFIRCA